MSLLWAAIWIWFILSTLLLITLHFAGKFYDQIQVLKETVFKLETRSESFETLYHLGETDISELKRKLHNERTYKYKTRKSTKKYTLLSQKLARELKELKKSS